jgi:hypothetical protein
MEEQAIEIFFSLVSEDQAFYKPIKQHLAPLRRMGKISCWSSLDAQTVDEARQHLESAQIIMALISSAYLDSDYHYQIELTRALERHKAGEALVIPVLARPCYYTGLPFAMLQMLPEDARPLSEVPEKQHDQMYRGIAQAIDQVIKQINFKKSPPAL